MITFMVHIINAKQLGHSSSCSKEPRHNAVHPLVVRRSIQLSHENRICKLACEFCDKSLTAYIFISLFIYDALSAVLQPAACRAALPSNACEVLCLAGDGRIVMTTMTTGPVMWQRHLLSFNQLRPNPIRRLRSHDPDSEVTLSRE